MNSRRALLFIHTLLIATMACSLPSVLSPATPTSQPAELAATAGPSPTPLPPVPPEVIETRPATGETVSPLAGFTLYFDQAMDQASVEAAFKLSPESTGFLSWQDQRTLNFQPSEPMQRATDYRVTIGTEAKSAQGLSPVATINKEFTTAGFAEVTQVSPAPSASGVSPTSRIQVAFNQPMVSLAVDQEQPQPLRFDPPVSGQGEWIGTSLYSFEPEPALPAGSTISVTVDPGLTAPDGAFLSTGFNWVFSTARPQLIETSVAEGQDDVPLDPSLSFSFNTPLSQASFEGAFDLTDPEDQNIAGTFKWNDGDDQVVFTPNANLDYGTSYRASFEAATGPAGTPLTGTTELSFTTVPEPRLLGSDPAPGGVKNVGSSLRLFFSGPMSEASLLENISLQPEVESLSVSWYPDENTLYVHGDYQPTQRYTLQLDPAEDAYGTPLAQGTTFSFSTGNYPPRLDFTQYIYSLTFTAGRPQNLSILALNIDQVQLSLNQLTLDQYFLAGDNAPQYLFDAEPLGQPIRNWTVPLSLTPGRSQIVQIPLSESGSLPTGAYQIIIDSPQDNLPPRGKLLLVRGTELVLKAADDELLVWAVDLDSGQPLDSFETTLLDRYGQQVGQTAQGRDGFSSFSLNPKYLANRDQIVTVGNPGDPSFSLTSMRWQQGIEPWSLGIPSTSMPIDDATYLYTDRPLYRPGQTVHYKGIYRQFDERGYSPSVPEISSSISVSTPTGLKLDQPKVSLSDYGTFSGSFELDENAPLGTYRLSTGMDSVFFEVAAYRKPEFELTLTASDQDRIVGQPLTVDVQADYFFGAPVANTELSWQAIGRSYQPPDLPTPYSFRFSPFFGEFDFGTAIAQGTGVTDGQGHLKIEVPTELEEPRPLELTIQATISEDGALPVSGQATVNLHPSELYLSVIPTEYSLRSGEQADIRLHAVDYLGNALADQAAQLEVYRITWEQYVAEDGQLAWQEEETLVNRDSVQTEGNGSVLASFLPQRAGTYEVRASAQDEASRSAEASTRIWVVGEAGNIWRQQDPDQITLVPDKESYLPGETAQVLLPSPFDGDSTALVTVERESIIERRVLDIPAEGAMLEVPIQDYYLPNVYLSAILISPSGGEQPAAAAAGIINLPVSAESKRLQIDLSADRSLPQPGDEVTYQIEARDSDGDPVQAEFSLGLVDEALLALTEPNSQDPFEALYDQRPHGVGSALGLLISGETRELEVGGFGRGGGGGDDVFSSQIRQQFEDTAYWNPSVITDSNGLAEVSITLPDNLTSWRMEARGVTRDTEAGSAEHSVTVSKPLLIRPATPRFFTAGDQSTVAGVVHNNTNRAQTVDVRLSANGATIQSAETTTITVPAGDSQRVEWRLSIAEVEGVGLTFFAKSDSYQDASTPTVGTAIEGQIPVLRFSAPDTEATSGWLPEADSRTETISLPASFDPTQGELNVSLEPSLGSVIHRSRTFLNEYPYETTNHLAARLMVNAASLRIANESDEVGSLSTDHLEGEIDSIVQRLLNRQNFDGGWGWWSGSTSDTSITALVLSSLLQAQQAGFSLPDGVVERATEPLIASLTTPNALDAAGLVRQAFVVKVLNEVSQDYSGTLRSLASQSDRLPLRAKAFVVDSLAEVAPNDAQLPALVADLESAAQLADTGTHWDTEVDNLRYYASGIETTAHVARALLKASPESPNLAGAMRWLVLNRSQAGGWRTSANTGWATVALLDWVEAQGSWQANYDYQLWLNGEVQAEGRFQEAGISNGIQVTAPIADLINDRANVLTIERGSGEGTLSYTAHLTVYRPADQVTASSRGLSIERRYYLDDGQCDLVDDPCQAVTSAQVGDNLLVQMTLTVPSEVYFLAAEDRFGAGLEPIDPGLKTSQDQTDLPSNRYGLGWIGWRFNRVEFDDERLLLFADYLPAGTYSYVYRLHASFAGDYQTLPAQAWLTHFPEISGHSAGSRFSIAP